MEGDKPNTKVLEGLKNNPLALVLTKDQKIIDYFNNLIPYSTGFEIECDMSDLYNEEDFKNIPFIIDVDNNISEQRYRIPNGIRGMICLYCICYHLKYNSLLNPLSGIHYHVDCTDCWGDKFIDFIEHDKEEWILNQLDSWIDSKGAKDRIVWSWYKPNGLQTIEYRVGYMTFDYITILDRIIDANRITKELKEEYRPLLLNNIKFDIPDKNVVLNYYNYLTTLDRSRYSYILKLNNLLSKINKEESKENIAMEIDQIKQMYRNRVHNIYQK